MRIRSLSIRGYKSLRQFELEDLPDFAVFAGPNGSGKSAIFESIALLKETVGAYLGVTVPQGVVNLACEYAEVRAEFSVSQLEADRVRALQQIDVSTEELLPAAIKIVGQSASRLEAHPALRALFPVYEPSDGIGIFELIQAHRRMVPRALQQISLQSLDPQRFKQFRVTQLEDKFNQLKDQLAAIALEDVFRWRETGVDRDSLAPLKDLFNRLFAPKRFKSVMPTRGGVQFEIETPDGVHDIDLLSSGEREVFMVFATLMQIAPVGSIIMYDTPELHLHGAVERQVAGELARLTQAPNQVLLATHSVEFIGASPLPSLFHLEVYSGQNQVSPVSEEQDRLEIFESLGASVGLQLISPKVAFLEGEEAGSDKELLQTIFPTLSSTVALVPSRSVTDVMELAGRATDLLARGTRFSRFFSIRDRDYLSANDRQELMRRFPGLIILDRYHIENYLLDVEVIASVMAQLGYGLTSATAVGEALEAIAASLRENSVADWVRYQLDQRLRGLLLRCGGSDPTAVLKSSARDLQRVVSTEFTSEAIDTLAHERQSYLHRSWDSQVWLFKFPGRDLLRRFVGQHAGGIEPLRFRNLLASQLARVESQSKEALRQLLSPLF